jgi:MYXO-CTERM domain-containing protein
MKQYKNGFKALSALALGLSMTMVAPVAKAATVRVTASATMAQGSDLTFNLATLFPTSNFDYAYGTLYEFDAGLNKYVAADANLYALIDTNGDLKWDALQVWMSHDALFTGSQPLRMSGANSSGNAMVMDLGLTVTPLTTLSGTASTVPEPTTALLALLGLGGAVGVSRRRSR